jgi:hypothetical protein
MSIKAERETFRHVENISFTSYVSPGRQSKKGPSKLAGLTRLAVHAGGGLYSLPPRWFLLRRRALQLKTYLERNTYCLLDQQRFQ